MKIHWYSTREDAITEFASLLHWLMDNSSHKFFKLKKELQKDYKLDNSIPLNTLINRLSSSDKLIYSLSTVIQRHYPTSYYHFTP